MAGLIALLVLLLLLHVLVPAALLLAAPIMALPALAYAATPMGYALNEQTLRIERKALWSITVPLSQISACHPLPRAALRHAIRVYGTGGLFGWAGRYQLRQWGAISMHATNLDRLLLVRRRNRRSILISPTEPDRFLVGLRRQYETIVLPPPARGPRQVRR
jgi:hypothetical protein